MTTQSPLLTSITGGGNRSFTAKTGLETPFGAAVMYDIRQSNVFVAALTFVATVASNPAHIEIHFTILAEKTKTVDKQKRTFSRTGCAYSVGCLTVNIFKALLVRFVAAWNTTHERARGLQAAAYYAMGN